MFSPKGPACSERICVCFWLSGVEFGSATSLVEHGISYCIWSASANQMCFYSFLAGVYHHFGVNQPEVERGKFPAFIIVPFLLLLGIIIFSRVCHCDAAVLASPPFSVFEYLKQYPKFFDVARFHHMRIDGNEFPVQDCLCRRCDTAVVERVKCWNHWGSLGAFSCHRVGKETDSPLVRCRKEVYYERRLVDLLSWMLKHGDSLANKPNLEYFVWSAPFVGVWFVDLHEYWGYDCDLKMLRRTSLRMTKTIVGCQNVEVFGLPLRDGPVSGQWVGWESSRSNLVPSRSIFSYDTSPMMCGSEAGNAHIWRIVVT